jgi:hypothetical protein
MPTPIPKKNETRSDFINRCMQNDTMIGEYPETEQRLAVCYRSWSTESKKTK